MGTAAITLSRIFLGHHEIQESAHVFIMYILMSMGLKWRRSQFKSPLVALLSYVNSLALM